MAVPKKPEGPWHLELDPFDSDAHNDYYRVRLEFDDSSVIRDKHAYPVVSRVDKDNALGRQAKARGYVGWHMRSESIVAMWKPE